MFKRKLLSALPLLIMAMGYSFSVEGSEGGGQSDPSKTGNSNQPVDVAAEVAKATTQLQQQFAQQLKEATGHDSIEALKAQQLQDQGRLQELADTNANQAAQYKGKWQQTQINNSLLAAASEAIDADVITSLLANKATVDDNGVVTINGKSAKDAVADLLKAKPHLAKASGVVGSSTPHSQTTDTPIDVSKMTAAQKMAFGRQQQKS